VRYVPRYHIYTRPILRFRWPRIYVHISWPWVIRVNRYWAPRYRYRQVVYVQSTLGRDARRTRVELETRYRHRVLAATDDRAELEITIEAIDIYYEGRLLGTVDYVPDELSRLHATVYSDGRIGFDREIFLLGDPYRGFELVSTLYYPGSVLNEYRAADGYIAGRVDLRTGSVYRIAGSRLFDPYAASGYIPVSLLPENEGWLWDYGADAISAATDDYDYYYGSGSALGIDRYLSDPYSSSDEYSFRTPAGADVVLRRESEIQRVE